MEESVIKELELCLQKDFEIEGNTSMQQKNFDELKRILVLHIQQLLNTDLNKLLNIFYRIDLNEKKVKEILVLSKPGDVASDLAELIIERELIKVKTRLAYKKGE